MQVQSLQQLERENISKKLTCGASARGQLGLDRRYNSAHLLGLSWQWDPSDIHARVVTASGADGGLDLSLHISHALLEGGCSPLELG